MEARHICSDKGDMGFTCWLRRCGGCQTLLLLHPDCQVLCRFLLPSANTMSLGLIHLFTCRADIVDDRKQQMASGA